ncbi:MAG: extracellular solute-binding protein [Geminicoccaceae bacterium]
MTDDQFAKPEVGATRRRFIKNAAIVGAAVAAPAVVSRKALSSSGEINVIFWSDELPDPVNKAFTDATGIKVNFTGFGSNEELINKLKATNGRGFDIAAPTADRAPVWAELNLLQPIDLKKVPFANLNPAMAKVGEEAWNFNDKGSHWLPHVWGTEGIAWRTDQFKPAGEFPSYGDVWDDANAGKTMGRAHSMLLGAGLYLERIGQLEPGSMWAAYESEEKMRPVWEKVTDWAISKKKNIKTLWNDADTQKNALSTGEVIVGQTWDGPPLALKTAGEPVTYRAPMEGAMAWIDGIAIPVGAENLEQAYAFLNWILQPEPQGKAIDKHGYNSAVTGAEKFAGPAYAKNFAEAYPGDALQKLNPWPPTQPWYSDIRTEYANKFQSAS